MEKILTRYWGDWDAVVELIPEKPPKRAEAIKDFAGGSMYRMNAQSADCYAFSFYGGSWEGGWDWMNHLVDTNARHLYSFKDDAFYRIVKK